MNGQVILPKNEQYDEIRKVWNGAIDKHPKAIAVCESESDVVAAVEYAIENDLLLSIRGGGHHLAGTAVCDDGLMIDLSHMKKVEVDQERKVAIVQGGATLGDIDKETQKYGLATPTGTVSETGVAGLALGGGMGYLRGKHGLTCDNIVGVHLVTAEGKLIHVNEQSHQDLFWAIRGGGGNFGIVTQFEFQLHNVGPEVMALDVMYDFNDAKEILQKAQDYADKAPDELSFNLAITQLPPVPFLPEFLHHKKVIMVAGMYAGSSEDGEKAIQPLREWAKPLVDQSGIMPFVQLQSKLDEMAPNHVPVFGTSLYFSALDEKTITALLDKLETVPASTALVQLWALGGQMNRVAPDATAFAIRDAKFVLLLDMMALGVEEDVCEQWVNSVYHDLLPYSHLGASYLNGIGLSEKATQNSYADNYERLFEIKKKYDPTNLFRFNHNIR